MFDLSWSELLLIAVVALIVIGPKDLPTVLKAFAQFARKARSLAREFQSGIEEMAREAELDEVKKSIESTAATDFDKEFEHSIDPGGEFTKSLTLQSEDAASVPSIPSDLLTPATTETEATPSVGESTPASVEKPLVAETETATVPVAKP